MDLAEAHVSALRHTLNHLGPRYDTFNLGSGKGHSVMELVLLFEKISGQPLPHRIGDRRAGDVVAVWADAQKSANVLGWQTKRTLEEALKDAWRWQQGLNNKTD